MIDKKKFELMWLFIGKFISILISFLTIKILTEYLSHEEYGNLALGMSVVLLINQTLLLGIINAVGRYYSEAIHRDDFGGLIMGVINNIRYVSLLIMAISLPVILIFKIIECESFIGIYLLLILFSLLAGCVSCCTSIFNSARLRGVVAYNSTLESMLKLTMLWLISKYFDLNIEKVVVIYCVASFIVLISQSNYIVKYLFNKISYSIDSYKYWSKKLNNFSWPFSKWGFFTWAFQVSDIWILYFYSNTNVVGQYAVLYQIGFIPLSIIIGIILDYYAPLLYNQIRMIPNGDEQDKLVKDRILNLALAFFVFVGIFFIFSLFFHRLIFDIAVAEKFRNISYLLPYMIFASGIFAVGQIFAMNFSNLESNYMIINLKIITSILGIILNVVLVLSYGINGIVVGMLLYSIVYTLWMIYLVIDPLKRRSGK